ALWLGIEDMTGALVKKGQSVDKTLEAFDLLCQIGISPMPMMMHHDAQPFYTRGKPEGLYNQVKLLRKAGAVSLQVLMVTPSAGSKLYEDTFRSGMVYDSVAGRRVEDHMYDGNFVIASHAPKPWRKQLNLTLAYLSFYNIFRMIGLMLRRRNLLSRKRIMLQILGILGLGYTIRRTTGWLFRLLTGRIERLSRPTYSAIPMRSVDGGIASHDLPAMMVPFDEPAPPSAPAAQPQNA
ncbi:MAG: radical SAM protein, partial [Planctomycetota bacterium]|nr:radical SAM protein [Planctomycetota bacterium]